MKYITRSMTGITIVDQTTNTIDSSLIHYLNQRCIASLSTYQGRITAARIILQQTQCVPLYITDSIVLIPTRTIRNPQMIYINSRRIIHLKRVNHSCVIVFDDWTELDVDVSYRLIQKRLNMAKRLLETSKLVR